MFFTSIFFLNVKIGVKNAVNPQNYDIHIVLYNNRRYLKKLQNSTSKN